MVGDGGKTSTLRGNWTSSTLYQFGNKTFVFEIPEGSKISLIRFGPLPPIDVQRKVIVDISQKIKQNPERQKALVWIRANVLREKLVEKLPEDLDMAMAMETNIDWHIGWDLTKSKKPYAIQWADGEFIFDERSKRPKRKNTRNPM